MTNSHLILCGISGCDEPATQMHGILPDLIYTCDEHAEAVMLNIVSLITEPDND